MPRHTHPAPVRKHSRTHTREQRDRYIGKRWQRSKRLYGYHDTAVHPEESVRGRLQVIAREERAVWPFFHPDNEFSRNPFNRCSCPMCRGGWRPGRERRREEEPLVRRDIQEMLEGGL